MKPVIFYIKYLFKGFKNDLEKTSFYSKIYSIYYLFRKSYLKKYKLIKFFK